MEKRIDFLLVDSKVLPEVFVKVIQAKSLLQTGKCKTASEAAKLSGISRSAFYKYKDHVLPIEEMGKDRVITLFFLLLDHPGTLSGILSVLAHAGANILTINQNIPINSVATVTVTIRAKDMTEDISSILSKLKTLKGVCNAEVIAGE